MLSGTRRQVPGINFDVVTPQPPGSLPRMDVAVFVGFAARGPLQLPTAIESARQFLEVFGEDMQLAWDSRRRVWIQSLLGPSVRGFFSNGGQRCWVVRVGIVPGAVFDPKAFLDRRLEALRADELALLADRLVTSQRDQPTAEPLRGIHACWAIEEATLIAAPDAVHFGWALEPEPQPAEPEPGADSPPAPEEDAPVATPPCPCGTVLPAPPCFCAGTIPARPHRRCAESQYQPGAFNPCAALPTLTLAVEAASMPPPDGATQDGGVVLSWTALAPPPPPDRDVVYEVWESRLDWPASGLDPAGAELISKLREQRLTVSGRAAGAWYYRVTARVDGTSTGVSNSLAVVVPSAEKPTAFDPSPIHEQLLRVQRALIRLCAARGDLFAVLALPEQARTLEALKHAKQLRSADVPGEMQPAWLSYAALVHPWLLVNDSVSTSERDSVPIPTRSAPALTRCLADGAFAGLLAARARERGAWVPVANQPLANVLALAPDVDRADWPELLGAGVSVLAQTARGFLPIDALTLSEDADFETIGVRRLLMLLRRLALQRGAVYVFEPNDSVLRRAVEASFRGALGGLFARGAFAGETAGQAFRVTTSTNRALEIEQELGQLSVELQVAPSTPLSFITLRLVQQDGRATLTELAS